MNTSRDPIKIGGKKVSLHGKFRLTSNKDASKIHLINIDSFIPQGKTINEKLYFYDINGPVNTLYIDRKFVIFNPDNNEIDAKNITTLIQHPDVRLEDMTDNEHEQLARLSLKKDNPEWTLVNLDKAITDQHDEDVDLIEIKYLITKKKDPLSKKKLMYISSALGLPLYSDITDEVRYIGHLQRQLSNFLQVNIDRRTDFKLFYDKISEAEIMYYINELMNLDVIKDFGGMYKINDVPVGFKTSDIKDWFAANEAEYEELKLKVQEFNSNKITK